jgi:flagellar hook-basal body complex protein FliE
MTAPIIQITGAPLPEAIRPAGQAGNGAAFQEVFSSAIENVESFSRNAAASVERFLRGEGEELHTTILATQRAELSFEMFLQVRNKVVNAYQEIMRMPM